MALTTAPTAASGASATASGPATRLVYAPDGASVFASTADGSVSRIALSTGTAQYSISAHPGAEVSAVAVTKRGDVLATASSDSTIALWSTKNGKPLGVLQGHEQPATSLAFSPDGSRLITGGQDSRVLVWDVATRALAKVVGGQSDMVTGLAFNPDGSSFAASTRDGRITIRSAATFNKTATLRGHAKSITDVEFSPDGTSVVSSSLDGTVKVWNVAQSRQTQSFSANDVAFNAVSIAPDGGSVAAASEDANVRIWDLGSGALSKQFPEDGPVADVAYSPDGSRVADGTTAGKVKEWKLSTGEQTATADVPQSAPVTSDTRVGSAAATADAAQAAALSAGAGTGTPILIVTSGDNYGQYYSEILRAEGLNSFATASIAEVTPAMLADYDVVILASGPVDSGQAATLSDWVNTGGNLVAMRPGAALSSLLGLNPVGTTMTEGYLKIDTSTTPGAGIVGDSLQFHGTADRYTTAGSRSVATLYSDATTATSNPAVTLRDVGTSGGQAAAFTFDLARSIVYTRQGNPAWAGQERDGQSPIRSDDLFFGDAASDRRADWIDLNKVAIPQADELQRLLVNLILDMNKDRKPLPRFWYLPRGLKAAVIMTGDDHGNNGTQGRFDQFLAASDPGCSVADWECIRGTSYIYPSTPLTSTKATTYANQGFEIGLHLTTNCQNWTPSSLATNYTTQLADLAAKYPGIPAPKTNRTHCIAWSDWSTQANVELSKGIRLDTNYYYWPPGWVNDRPGFFTGSGFPMRFTDPNGALIDVYQAASQMTDESGQSFPYTIDTLLDRALGPEGFYGAFTINAHTDADQIVESTSVVASAKARGVPVITSAQMLEWLDGRNNSTFSNLAWNAGQLSFTVAAGQGARNLDMLIPTRWGSRTLADVTRDGTEATFTKRVVKGVEYALVRASAGTYSATYAADTTAPQITGQTPNDGATGRSTSATPTVTFDEPIDPSTVNTQTFELRRSGGATVSGRVAYNQGTQTATFTPDAPLSPNTTYVATVRGGSDPTVRDVAGNALTASSSWTFTTDNGSNCPCTIWASSATPVNGSENDPSAVELGVKFRSDVAGFVTGVRFWKGAQNTGTHVGSLWSRTGQRLATATFANESASGWQEVSFSSPVAIDANTTYIASYFAPRGYYAGDNNGLNTSVDRAPLHALASGTDGGNGVYAYSSSSTFPSSSWQASNYWVDVVFTTSTGPDTKAPTVTSTSPAADAQNVSRDAVVTATFDEALDPATVSTATARITGPGATAVAASVTYTDASRTVTLRPDTRLQASTTYTVELDGGSTGAVIKDLAGNALAADRTWSFTTAAPGTCDNPPNGVVAENCLPGSPPSEWDVSGIGDSTIQGFATDISVNRGATVDFKIDTSASSYRVDIYRLGYYGGDGARKVATIAPADVTAKNQAACLTQSSTGLIDCGNWTKSASWQVPADAVSGVYIARPTRTDTGGASHIPFVVRQDGGTSDVVFQTADTTWQAYNNYGGNSLYTGSPAGRAYKVSYNRPFWTRGVDNGQDWLFNAEFPMIRWLEANGYDVSYITGVDSHRSGSLLRDHKTFLSVGHDEYWSGAQRSNVEAARDAGVNLAFLSGNEVFWKTRWEASIDGSSTGNRTLVCYKETAASAKIDPDPSWTGTWRDPRFSPPSDGGRPENSLTGTLFMVNDGATTALKIPAEEGKMRLWRDTSVANLAAGATATMPNGTLGYEWDVDADNGSRPAGLIRLSSTTVNNAPVLQDFGSTYGSGTAVHNLTMYRQPGGGLVFGAGTVQWSWGLDATHDRAGTPVSPQMQQATVNLLADMDAQPSTLQAGLTRATKSTDTAAPTTVITNPADNARVNPNSTITITGTASDAGAGRVAAVEVSTDGGTTWKPAIGRTAWTYSWTAPATGRVTILARAVDDSANLQTTATSVSVDVASLPAPAAPAGLTATPTTTGVSLDWNDNSEADLAGYNVYRATSPTGTFTKVNTDVAGPSAWDDTTAPSGAVYYRVTAVNQTGGESSPSSVTNATVAKANRLANAAFEIDANADGRPDSWTSSARFTATADSARSGSKGGKHSATSNAGYTIRQTVTGLTAGSTYDFGGWVRIPSTTDAFTLTVAIEWRNSSNKILSTQTVKAYNSPTGGWDKAAGAYVAPTGATRASVAMVATSLIGPVHVDDFSLR